MPGQQARTAQSERQARHQRLLAVEAACRQGDIDAFRAALGDPPGFPNGLLPAEFLGIGDTALAIALTHADAGLIRALLEQGADPNAPAADGFPSLIAAIDRPRGDRHAVLALLLEHGADTAQRGINDCTPLHHAVARRDLAALRLLLRHGADPLARTRIDDLTTPLEDAAAIGFEEAIGPLREAAVRMGMAALA